MLIAFLFLVLILVHNEPTNFKKSYSWIPEKHDQTSINLTNVFYRLIFELRFSRLYSVMGWFPDTFKNFQGSYYSIRFKPYATSKMELFMTKNR